MVGRIATVVVVLLGLAWMPIMMNMGNLYSYLQDIQSLIAPVHGSRIYPGYLL